MSFRQHIEANATDRKTEPARTSRVNWQALREFVAVQQARVRKASAPPELEAAAGA